MTLNLHDHLLEPINGLIATLLGELLVDVVARLVGDLTTTILGLVGHVGRGLGLERLDTGSSASTAIDAGRGVILLIMSGQATGVARVTGTGWVGVLSGIPGHITQVLPIDGLLSVELVLGLFLEVLTGEIRGVVPGVALGGTIDLAQLVIGWVETIGRILGSVPGDVTQEDGGVAH